VIQDAWGWIYLLVAFKTGTWWFRRAQVEEHKIMDEKP
jgi:hypothetical protein